MSNTLEILVTGATGLQGGAVVDALIRRKHRVRAFTRNLDSRAAASVEAMGAEMCEGDFDDVGTLMDAMDGVDGVFLMGTPYEDGVVAERRHGRTVIDAAREHRVSHVVYSSVAGADMETGIPHFESKWAVEKHLRRSDVPYTVVAPVFFMENFVRPPLQEELAAHRLRVPLPRRRPLQVVAIDDFARLVATVFERPGDHLGRRVEVASDELNCSSIAQALSRAMGTQVKFEEVPITGFERRHPDVGKMFRWLNTIGYQVNIDALHDRYPRIEWTPFIDWVDRQWWPGARLTAS